MSVRATLTDLGGVARTRDLIDRGVSAYRIAAAVRSGEAVAPRRGWAALPDADAALVYAARHGILLTCVTQATRLGLWVASTDQHHVAASSAARANAAGCTVHWGKPLIPRRPALLADPLQNVLQYVAACQPAERALVIWESALNKRLVDLSSLKRLPFRGAARRMLDECRPFADSGLESLVVSRLRWLRVRLTPQAHLFGHRVDLLIGERLVVQLDGASHTGTQRDEDIAFDRLLTQRGYHVIRASYVQVMHRWHVLQLEIMEIVAQGRHLWN